MLTKSEKIFSVVFLLILIAELICGSIASLSQFHYITKPAIVISLIAFFWKVSKTISKPIRNFTLLALIFSLLGDVLLMFVDESANFFMLGLIAFLVAHVFYIFVFLKQRNTSKNALAFIGILFIYALVLFYLLKDGLNGMLIPVAIYIIVILTMSVTAFLREDHVSRTSYILVFLGAIFFMVSDTILALHKFYDPIPFSNISVMITYALAQYLIIFGIKKSNSF